VKAWLLLVLAIFFFNSLFSRAIPVIFNKILNITHFNSKHGKEGKLMGDVKIFWDPIGVTVDSIGSKRYIRVADGDTPFCSMSIRMLSIDTPETHYPGNTKPSRHDADLNQLATWIQQGHAPVQNDLGAYLVPKLSSGTAGTLQRDLGDKAEQYFENLLDQKLDRGPNRKKRSLYIRAADEHFDQFGRLLAYVAPNYSASERATMTPRQRATFNLLMVESGWAATFPIYPSIPSYPNLVMLRDAAKNAYDNNLGAWSDPLALTGYEFRMCHKLFKVTQKLVNRRSLSTKEKMGWISRYCVDMTTREIYYPQDYFKVEPSNRIFIWPKDVVQAVSRMNLLPAD